MVCPCISPRYTAVVRSVAVSSEVTSRVGDCLFLDVLGDDEARPDVSDDPEHVGPEINGDAPSLRGGAEGLAGKAAANNVNGAGEAGCSDIGMAGDARPMLGENSPTKGLNLTEGNGSHAGALEPETEGTDSAEKVEDIHSPLRD